jgi:hypothetical protein
VIEGAKMNPRLFGAILLSLFMFIAALTVADKSISIQRTETITNNVSTLTDSAVIQDTFGVSPMIGDPTWKSVWGEVILAASANSARGYGLTDSGWIWLYTSYGGDFFLVDSGVKEGLPCTLKVAHTSSTAGADTLWKQDLKLVIKVYDSVGDTVMTSDHDVDYHFILKE